MRESAEQMKRFYAELSSRGEALSQGEQPISGRELPEDSMFT